MVDFEDELRKINDLSGKYEEKIDAQKEEEAVTRKQSEAAADIVKAKIKKLEDTLSKKNMSFEIIYPIGEPAMGPVSLIKTAENKIYMLKGSRSSNGLEFPYMEADPDLLNMITDQVLGDFLDKIQKELENRLSN